MFSVPGWSVPLASLKTQTVKAEIVNPTGDSVTHNENVSLSAKFGKKRKRKEGRGKSLKVTAQNLDELWKEYIEEDNFSRVGSRTAKTSGKDNTQDVEKTTATSKEDNYVQPGHHGSSKNPKRHKTSFRSESETDESIPRASWGSQAVAMTPVDRHPSSVKSLKDAPLLTPLQQTMRQKLISARFRHLNQTLYTTESSHSFKLFQENPEMFQEYHEGFRRQVAIWPENPVDAYIQQIRQRGSQKPLAKGKVAPSKVDEASQMSLRSLPLPRTHRICRVADLGCGDARIAQGLEKDQKKLNLRILSYDLQSSNSFVTKADIAHLPLPDESIDLAIFCLALMGTNWIDFIEEASRVLRWKGELWVAEIKSRFVRNSIGKPKVPDHSVGHKRRSEKPAVVKNLKEDLENGDFPDESEGRGKGDDSDVSEFVEVLRRRGFSLHTPDAVDLNNKMFVKMTFIKALTPTKGRFAPQPGINSDTASGWVKRPKHSTHEKDQDSQIDETSVLKPCVYKLR